MVRIGSLVRAQDKLRGVAVMVAPLFFYHDRML